MDNIERQRKHFDAIADAYRQGREARNHVALKDLLWRFFLGGKTELRRDGLDVLEPMCGFGDGKEILEKNLGVSVNYEGFDYSENAVAFLKESRPDLKVVNMDVTQYRPERAFDIVFLIGGLHHVPGFADGVVRSMADALRPGGHFINFEPTHDSALVRRVRERIYKKNPIFDEQTEKDFPLSEINAMYERNGFEIVDQIYPGLLAYTLWYNPFAFPALNHGGAWLVRLLFRIESVFYRSALARRFSFATLTLLRKKKS